MSYLWGSETICSLHKNLHLLLETKNKIINTSLYLVIQFILSTPQFFIRFSHDLSHLAFL
ncbi:hypothetical protein SAMN05660479_03384, partial [Microbulbifer thermotolerans]